MMLLKSLLVAAVATTGFADDLPDKLYKDLFELDSSVGAIYDESKGTFALVGSDTTLLMSGIFDEVGERAALPPFLSQREAEYAGLSSVETSYAVGTVTVPEVNVTSIHVLAQVFKQTPKDKEPIISIAFIATGENTDAVLKLRDMNTELQNVAVEVKADNTVGIMNHCDDNQKGAIHGCDLGANICHGACSAKSAAVALACLPTILVPPAYATCMAIGAADAAICNGLCVGAKQICVAVANDKWNECMGI